MIYNQLDSTSIILFLICIFQLVLNISAQSQPSSEPTYEPHPSMLPTPANYADHNPTSFPTNAYSWNESTTIAVSLGSIIGGSAVVAAGYFAYTRGLFSPDDVRKGSIASVGDSSKHTPSNNTTNPLHAPGDAKNPEMMPLLDAKA